MPDPHKVASAKLPETKSKRAFRLFLSPSATNLALVRGFCAALLALALFVVMHHGSQDRAAVEIKSAQEIDIEGQAFCRKFGLTSGTTRFAECKADLLKIRGRHELRVARDHAGVL